jgi:DNA-binding transcriptional regulator YdaS (Cro superfamily)
MEQIIKTPIERAIFVMGGVAETVRKLGLGGHATVYQWTKNRVPAERCPQIEAATGGVVRCEDLRPDVQWSVLRNTQEQAQAHVQHSQATTQTIAIQSEALCEGTVRRQEARRADDINIGHDRRSNDAFAQGV